MQSYGRSLTLHGEPNMAGYKQKKDCDLDIMSTYSLRRSSCIFVVEGPVGFGPEIRMG